MQLTCEIHTVHTTHPFIIARGGTSTWPLVWVKIRDNDGVEGWGEAAPSRFYGETAESVLAAVRWHTVGFAGWDRAGRALYMADFLEPGRGFMKADRAFLVEHLPHDFDGVFRQVVRMRLEWTLREGKALFPEAVGLWNSVR